MRKKTISPVPLPTISDAEWAVMKVLWQRAPQTTNQVVDALTPHQSWKPKTIHTLLRRLVDKGALRVEKQGREFSYHPEVSAEECQLAESKSFLGRVFDGQMAPFLAAFVERQELSATDLAKLKQILDRNN